jgi:hypothetical protein
LDELNATATWLNKSGRSQIQTSDKRRSTCVHL